MATLRPACVITALVLATAAAADSGKRCLVASGKTAAECVRQYASALRDCHEHPAPSCDATLRAPGGKLDTLLAATEAPVREKCTPDAADKLTFLAGLDDLVARTAQACRKWGEDLVTLSESPAIGASAADPVACRKAADARLARLHDKVVRAYGRGCYVAEFGGRRCDRTRRDHRVARARSIARSRLRKSCGTLPDALFDTVVDHARHLAQRVYPPLNLGPTGLPGRFPVGLRTLHLIDDSRLNVAGDGPRPLDVEVYYPSTAAAVSGVERDRPLSLFTTPTYRDVARAPGTFPLVMFSPGGGSDPWEYVYLAAHLASHGYVVASVTHQGNHLLDTTDPSDQINRPLDIRALLDQLLAMNAESGSFFEGATDPARIGAAGHSRGGYTAMALATCPFPLGSFTDPRVKAIFTLEGGFSTFGNAAPGIFSTIRIPTLLVAGPLSGIGVMSGFAFDELTPGPPIMAYANLADTFHGSFTDVCEVPDATLEAFNGGPVADCEPGALPWRYARHIDHYLALNFFDAMLRGDADALARLDPNALAAIEELTWEQKPSPANPPPPDPPCMLPCGNGTVGSDEACDSPGSQGICPSGETCNENCTACVSCSGATVIPLEGGVFEGTTVGGTSVFGSTCGADVFAPERVFAWTPNGFGVATIETCGGTTDYDTTLSVRLGTCLGQELACNDDGSSPGCGTGSSVGVEFGPGTTYYIVVDGFGTESGHFTLRVHVP